LAAESLPEQIVAAMVTSLAAISGSTYHYPPDKVVRSSFFGEHCLDESVGDPATVYVLIPDVYEFEEQTFTHTAGLLELDLVLMRRHEVGGVENPFEPPTSSRWQVQNRMIHDVQTKLRADLTVGGRALHTRLTLADVGAEETFEEMWAMAFLRVEVEYDFADTNP